jgi:hypothetical protein
MSVGNLQRYLLVLKSGFLLELRAHLLTDGSRPPGPEPDNASQFGQFLWPKHYQCDAQDYKNLW